MRVIVTCGPAYEPIDQVRRITNFSTGQLGISLSNRLTGRGAEVLCFKGEQATSAEPLIADTVRAFSTNDDLMRQLRAVPQPEQVLAVFHAAALCDFRVESVSGESGVEMSSAKFSSRQGRLRLVLAPAIKVLPFLRDWFPRARIVGWKYEPDGTPAQAVEKAWLQIRESRTDACVVNGRGYGSGFGFCTPANHGVLNLPDGAALIEHLVDWCGNADKSGG